MDGVAAAYAVITALYIATLVITALKSKWGMLVLGLFLGMFVTVPAAMRLAKPGSWWAERYCPEGSLKLRLAHERFPDARRTIPAHPDYLGRPTLPPAGAAPLIGASVTSSAALAPVPPAP